MKTSIIIPAAGTGSRMGSQKQLLLLAGVPVLYHTIAAFENHEEADEIIVVAPNDMAKAILDFKFKKIKNIVEGGCNRQASVWAGIKALSPDTAWVLIHDGARPLVSGKAISDVLAMVRSGFCAISGVKSKDTIKITGEDDVIEDTPVRERAWLVQTPQGFPYHLIKKAHLQAIADGFEGTDDAILAERMGIPVYMVEGDYSNIKLTTPEDLRVAEALIHKC